VEKRGVPLIPLHLFRNRGYVAGSAVNLFFQAGLVGFFLFFTIYLQSAVGYSPIQAGLSWLGFSLGTLAGSIVAVQLTPRLGRRLVTIGAAMAALGVVWLLLAASDPSVGVAPNGWDFVGGLVLGGLGMGLLIVPLFDLTLEAVPTADAGAASGALSTIQQIGGALGVAAIGAVFYSIAGASPDASTLATALHGAAWGCVLAFAAAAMASLVLRARAPHDLEDSEFDSADSLAAPDA
jgi:MFS family permease